MLKFSWFWYLVPGKKLVVSARAGYPRINLRKKLILSNRSKGIRALIYCFCFRISWRSKKDLNWKRKSWIKQTPVLIFPTRFPKVEKEKSSWQDKWTNANLIYSIHLFDTWGNFLRFLPFPDFFYFFNPEFFVFPISYISPF